MSYFINIWRLSRSYELKEKEVKSYRKKAMYAFLHGVFKALIYLDASRHVL